MFRPWTSRHSRQFSRDNACAKGVGLAGRVWAAGRLVCVADMSRDASLIRSSVAAVTGLRGAIGFPVRNGGELLGVMEFFSKAITQPEDGIVQMMACIGGQISQFIERREAEKVLQDQDQERRTAANDPGGVVARVHA